MPRKVKTAWEIGSTVFVVAAAVAMLFLFIQDRRDSALSDDPALRFVDSWRDWTASAITVGDPDARMVVSAFMDFQCPHCRNLASVIDSLLAAYPQDLALQFHHFPLNGHRAATPAAMAADCAERQGRFKEMNDLLFRQMDSLGIKPWSSFAEEAGLKDVPLFRDCMDQPLGSFPRILTGRKLGKSVGVRGTPKVWINGVLFQGRTVEAFQDHARSLGVVLR